MERMTFIDAVKLPVESVWIGISAPTILTWSSVAVVLAKTAAANTPISPPKILVLETVCSLSPTTRPKIRLSVSLL